MKKWYGVAFLLYLFFLLHCTNNNPIAGGTVIPNLVIGHVLHPDKSPAQYKTVTLTSVILTRNGEQVIIQKSAITNVNGAYTFGNIQKGKYVVTCFDSVSGESAVISKMEKSTDSTVINDHMFLKNPARLHGRILFNQEDGNIDTVRGEIKVFIPGITCTTSVDSEGFYSLNGVPQGHYDLCFVSGNTMNLLPITVNVDSANERTVYIQDVLFQNRITTNDIYTFFPYDSTLKFSFAVIPRFYKLGYEPPWYKGKDFSGVTYFSVKERLDQNKFTYMLTVYKPKYTMLFIKGSNSNSASDADLKSHLEKDMGFSVFQKSDVNVKLSDTAGMDIMFISSSAFSDSIKENFTYVDIPVIVNESYYYPRMCMTDTVVSTHFGNVTTYDGFIKIVNPSHAIAAGFENYVKFIALEENEVSGAFKWGKPAISAQVIATMPGNDDVSLIFGYDQGATMFGVQAPARRVGFCHIHSNMTQRQLTSDGFKIFRASVMWAIGF